MKLSYYFHIHIHTKYITYVILVRQPSTYRCVGLDIFQLHLIFSSRSACWHSNIHHRQQIMSPTWHVGIVISTPIWGSLIYISFCGHVVMSACWCNINYDRCISASAHQHTDIVRMKALTCRYAVKPSSTLISINCKLSTIIIC